MEVKCLNGIFGEYTEQCPEKCEWRESCRIFSSSNPEKDRKLSHSVSYDETENIIHEKQRNSDSGEFEQFTSMLTYLLSLDDNTFAFVCDIIEYPGIQQAELARRRGVSRQRINTALLHSCRRHPELIPLFRLCVGRRTMQRNRYARKAFAALELTPNLPGIESDGAGENLKTETPIDRPPNSFTHKGRE